MPREPAAETLRRFVLGDETAFEQLFRQFEAVVPNLWGLWHMLWIATKSKTRLSIGVHGAFIPALLVPAGILLARTTELFYIQMGYALLAIPVGMAMYYLAWKFLVGSLNAEIGVA